jgi:hypothetical protein
VDVAGRPFIGGGEDGTPLDVACAVVVNDLERHRRRQRVGQTDDGAAIEEPARGTALHVRQRLVGNGDLRDLVPRPTFGELLLEPVGEGLGSVGG